MPIVNSAAFAAQQKKKQKRTPENLAAQAEFRAGEKKIALAEQSGQSIVSARREETQQADILSQQKAGAGLPQIQNNPISGRQVNINEAAQREAFIKKAANEALFGKVPNAQQLLTQQQNPLSDFRITDTKNRPGETIIPQADNISPLGVDVSQEKFIASNANQLLPFAGKLAAKVIDTVRVGITGKKPLDVQQAEASLTDAMSALRQQLDAAQAGIISANDVKDNFIRARIALNKLEATQKGAGKANVRYWSDQGAEIEGEIGINKEKLQLLEAELNILIQSRIRANLAGQQLQ